MSRHHGGRIEAERRGELTEKFAPVSGSCATGSRRGLIYRPGLAARRCGRRRIVGDEFALLPDRLAVVPPDHVERPPRQRLTRIPLPLPLEKQASRSKPVKQPAGEIAGPKPLVEPERGGVPFGSIEVVNRDKRGLTPHREPHVTGHERRVDVVSNGQDPPPLRVGEGPGRARALGQPRQPHLETKLGPAGIDRACYRGGAGRIGRGGQG